MDSPASWRTIVTPQAERELRAVPTREQVRIRNAIDALAANPERSDIKKLKGREDEWRLRVGDWRIFFTYLASERALYVLSVRHRREAYR